MTNMYEWVKSFNPAGGACKHDCRYCYRKDMMKIGPQVEKKYTGKPFIDEKALKKIPKTDLVIFVCSMMDIMALPHEIILRILERCRQNPEHIYLFQSKNPRKFLEYLQYMPPKVIIGTTIESNRSELTDPLTNAPGVNERLAGMLEIPNGYDKMVSLEPIIDFDIAEFVQIIAYIHPKFVSIGADSKGHNLPEPSPEKIKELIKELEKFTEVRIKPNLRRLMKCKRK